MRLVVVAVGRWKAGPERGLFEHYARRITFPFDLKEVEEKKRGKPVPLKKREAGLLLAQAPKDAVIVALDEKGKALSSTQLAKELGRWRDHGAKHVAFMIGGAEGLDESVRKRARLVLSLGPMTWPHMLVRPMLAEQIYRVQCILSGHPYHRG